MAYPVTTSASLYEKAADLDVLALSATSPAHAAIYRRVADVNRVAAALMKLTETATI